MLESVKNKIAFLEVLKDVVETCNSMKEQYKGSRDYYAEKLESFEDADYYLETYKDSIEREERKISAIEAIISALGKLI